MYGKAIDVARLWFPVVTQGSFSTRDLCRSWFTGKCFSVCLFEAKFIVSKRKRLDTIMNRSHSRRYQSCFVFLPLPKLKASICYLLVLIYYCNCCLERSRVTSNIQCVRISVNASDNSYCANEQQWNKELLLGKPVQDVDGKVLRRLIFIPLGSSLFLLTRFSSGRLCRELGFCPSERYRAVKIVLMHSREARK